LPIRNPAESGQSSLGELQYKELFVVSVPNAPPAKANARKSAVFLVPRTCHPSFPLVANSDRDGTAPIFYTERKSIVSKERGKSVNCRRDGILTIEKAGFQPIW
jgi:hypothetical protein